MTAEAQGTIRVLIQEDAIDYTSVQVLNAPRDLAEHLFRMIPSGKENDVLWLGDFGGGSATGILTGTLPMAKVEKLADEIRTKGYIPSVEPILERNDERLCAACRVREGNDDTTGLVPDAGTDRPTQIGGYHGTVPLKCFTCGQEWTLIGEMGGGASDKRYLRRGRVYL